MNQQQYKVRFQCRQASPSGQQGRTVYVLAGAKVIEAAAQAGIIIETPCGGEGLCKKCKIKILSGQDSGEALACQTIVDGDMVVEVSPSSLLTKLDKITVSSDMPIVEFDGQHPCDKEKCCGVAVDVGTTTLAASLIYLGKKTEVAVAGAMNPQISLGDDVISRIKYASNGGLAELQGVVVSQVNELIETLCKQGGVDRENICEVAIAGNTTMEHLVCGVSPESLGYLPFEPVYRGGDQRDAAELKIAINSKGKVYVFPIVGGFVGGDTVAGMLAADILNQPSPLLFVDIGTNGEIVLVKDGKIMAASTAAGPAFEGAGISCGMRAAVGAIEKVKFSNNEWVYGVIGNVAPTGICGSGLIDITAELLNTGIVDSSGRMNRPEFVIADKVKITQKDIRQVQLAVGAIRAGINIMLKKAGVKTTELKKVLVAGGFGSFIRRNHAQRIGLLPGGIEHEKISFIGNSSLAGAKLSLMSIKVRQRAGELAEQTKHTTLSTEGCFQNEFAEAMIFPSA
ncbi:MAG: ASKHA domain-containing protein [Phycisphaerae bacterium]|nr:ASKHA domain-containing protein [Phycisphaerae bacterium]